MNTIVRTCLKKLNLVMMKREYYDPEEAVNIPVSRIVTQRNILFDYISCLISATPLEYMARLRNDNPSARRGLLTQRTHPTQNGPIGHGS